jgi:uncharacterized protein
MRIFSAFLLSFLALSLSGGGRAFALDASQSASPAPSVLFGSSQEALRSGVRAYNNGKFDDAITALQFAAAHGDTLALWKLGRMYADGDGVPGDDLKAFEYFSKIADEHADENPASPHARVVASAFVAVGSYFLEGIKGSYVKANSQRAHTLFHHAATYFGDPAAQYNLARLYVDGAPGLAADARQAARWLNLAAEKNHYPSQALLGHILVNGQGVTRQRARGLMWLTLAKDAAILPKDAWVVELYEKAQTSADEPDRQAALAQLEVHIMRRR